MADRLTGKRCLIVGGTSGIGLAASRLFLAEGAKLVAVGRDPPEAEQVRGGLVKEGPAHVVAARLDRLAFSIVWANPHKGKHGYAPVTAGMAAALPYVDAFVAGHNVAALEQLAAVISGGGIDARRPG